MWGTDWKIRHEGNCSAAGGLPSAVEQLSWVMEFSIRTEQPLKVLFLAYSFLTTAIMLEYVLFYQFYAKIARFFQPWQFVRLLSYTLTSKRVAETDMEMTSRRHNWRQYVILTSCTNESSLTLPHVRRHFLAPVGFTEIPVGYARNGSS